MRLIVSGSRSWNRPDAVWGCLDILAAECAAAGDAELLVVHGAAYPRERHGVRPDTSADWLAHLWCERGDHPLTVVEIPCPAAWRYCAEDCKPGHRKRNRNGAWYCPLAGHRRNEAMAEAGADLLLAFWRNGSAGTRHMIRAAEAAGIPVKTIDYADLPPLTPKEISRV